MPNGHLDVQRGPEDPQCDVKRVHHAQTYRDWAPVAQRGNNSGTGEKTYTYDPKVKFPSRGRWTVTSVPSAELHPHPFGDANLYIHTYIYA